MKKFLAILLSLLILVSLVTVGVSAEDGVNLLNNGDFNKPTTDYWWFRTDWNGGTWTYDATAGYEGTGGLIATGVGEGTNIQNAGLFYSPESSNELWFVSMANEEYQISFKVFYPEGVVADTYMDINEGALGSGHATGAGGWEEVSFTFTAPSAETIKIRLVVNSLSAQENVIVDDIKLVSLSGNHVEPQIAEGLVTPDYDTQELGDNLLQNGSFNGSSLSKWWFRTDWNGGNFQRIESGGVDNSPCLEAVGLGEGLPEQNAGVYYSGTVTQENYLQLESGKTYQLDVSFYRPASYTGSFYLDINEGALGSAACSTSDEWQNVNFRFVAPDTAIKVRVVANSLPEGRTCYVDDIEIREVGGVATGADDAVDENVQTLPYIEISPEMPLETEETGTDNTVLYIVIVAVAVVAVLVVILIIMGKKKKGGKE